MTVLERHLRLIVEIGLEPTWAKVEFLGQVVAYGFIGHAKQRSGMLTLVEPFVDGDEEHGALPEHVTHHGPGAIYRITPTPEHVVLASRLDRRPRKAKPAPDDDIPF